VQRAVRLSVAAVVESVAAGAAGAGLDRGGGAELREGGFASEALDVLAGGDEQLAGALGADSEELDGPRSGGGDELLELSVEFEEFAVERTDASGEATEGVLGRLQRLMQVRGVGTEAEAQSGSCLQCPAVPELTAQRFGCGDDQVVELLEGGGARFQRAGPGYCKLADRFDDPLVCFGTAVAVPASAARAASSASIGSLLPSR
jgi:hypothetical protein